MVGKSTCGSGATGRNGTATSPMNPMAAIRSDVATGRRMNGSEVFMPTPPCRPQQRKSATPCYYRHAERRARRARSPHQIRGHLQNWSERWAAIARAMARLPIQFDWLAPTAKATGAFETGKLNFEYVPER